VCRLRAVDLDVAVDLTNTVGRDGLIVTWDQPQYDLADPLVHPVARLMTALGYQISLAETD